MNTKFTPGPWSLKAGNTLVNVKGARGEQICQLRRYEQKHDARLVAAAPDGYAANVAMLSALDEAFGIKSIFDDERIYDELPSSGIARAYFMARAAIARATEQGHE